MRSRRIFLFTSYGVNLARYILPVTWPQKFWQIVIKTEVCCCCLTEAWYIWIHKYRYQLVQTYDP